MNEIQKLIKSYGGTAAFCEAFHDKFGQVIPYRTVHEWKIGTFEPRKWVMPLITASRGKKRYPPNVNSSGAACASGVRR